MLPDYRIRFPAPLIDFATDVGDDGLDVDDYGAPGQQPRYDWFRLFLLGLLANQASFDVPINFKEGSYWFDLNLLVMKVRRNDAWVPLAEAIQLALNPDGTPLLLSQWFNTMQAAVANSTPTATFGGKSNTINQTFIEIPSSLRGSANSSSKPLVYKNGMLLDPRKCVYTGSPIITGIQVLGGIAFDPGDEFTVILTNISSALFYTPDVII